MGQAAEALSTDVIACYLLQKTNHKLEEKLRGELAPGVRIVSNTYIFEGFHKVREDGKVRLYLFYPERGRTG